jgi:elongation factor 4
MRRCCGEGSRSSFRRLVRPRKLPSVLSCPRAFSTATPTDPKPTKEQTNPVVSILADRDMLSQIPLQDVRNFGFIAHIDHGKSSLSSRLLELCGNLGPEVQQQAWEAATGTFVETGKTVNKERIETLDTLSVEQERGITVKASTATMLYRHPSAVGPTGTLLLNMYDTPGHVDFGREVSRSLSFVQGAILLLDATQGIQAQTWSVHEKVQALAEPPALIMALTKIDLDSARPIQCALSICEWLDLDDPDAILQTSARSRVGIKPLLDVIASQVPPPKPMPDEDAYPSILRAQVVDSWYDDRGVNCLVRLLSGSLRETDRIAIRGSEGRSGGGGTSHSVQEVGLVTPLPIRTGQLERGQMGYIRFGLRDPRQALPGTILMMACDVDKEEIFVPLLPAYLMKEESVLYASVHPQEAGGFEDLVHAVERLALNDTGLQVSRTAALGSGETVGGPFLGPGLRVGFQGLLHVEVFRQRLRDEFGLDAVVTPPKVRYRITQHPHKKNKLAETLVTVLEDLSEWPEAGTRFTVEEPIVQVRILAPEAGPVLELMTRHRATDIETQPLPDEGWLIEGQLPWAEVVTDLDDQLKSVTAGYGSMTTQEAGYRQANLTKIDIVLNAEKVDPLSFVCHKDVAARQARVVCKKLQEVLPRQQFITVIQAVADGKIVAAERIRAFRKDVLTKSGKTVGGGDQTRKMKLLEKQKKGKKRMQSTGRVQLSQAAFNSVISRSG